MPFDPTNQDNLNTLKTEVETDPVGMGYEPASTTNGVIKPINDPLANVGADTIGERLTPRLLLQAIAVSPDDASVDAQFSDGLQFLMNRLCEFDDGTDIEEFRAALQGSMQSNNAIRQAMEAQSRRLSRAEVLFGAETKITRDDWFAARDRGVII